MLMNDKSQLKRNVEQTGFQLALKTSKSLSCYIRVYFWIISTPHEFQANAKRFKMLFKRVSANSRNAPKRLHAFHES